MLRTFFTSVWQFGRMKKANNNREHPHAAAPSVSNEDIAAHLFRVAQRSGTAATAHRITHYLVCRKCQSLPRARQHVLKRSALQIGITPLGLQIWCTRHEINVALIDFEHTRHSVVFSANCLSVTPPAKPVFPEKKPAKKKASKKKSRRRVYPFVQNSGNLGVIEA
jgi:hypothetical protein